jgi:predicted O-methyltransferase YrrM
MDLLSTQANDYLNNLVPPRPAELQTMEAQAEKDGFPIIGPACGQVCYQVARMLGATKIYEMGSGYGYSTAWFAYAVRQNGGGAVHHVVWDEQLSQQARAHLGALGYEDIVHYTVREAVDAISQAEGPFDIVFCDIDKHAYPEAIEAAYAKLRMGGALLIDNMLWSGRILDEADQSQNTQAIREATGMLVGNDRWITTILPIRDGLSISYKVK